MYELFETLMYCDHPPQARNPMDKYAEGHCTKLVTILQNASNDPFSYKGASGTDFRIVLRLPFKYFSGNAVAPIRRPYLPEADTCLTAATQFHSSTTPNV